MERIRSERLRETLAKLSSVSCWNILAV